MIPKLVTFDCAGTMVAVPPDWNLGHFAVACAREVGLFPKEGDDAVYHDLYMARLREFVAVNMSRNALEQEQFWQSLASDWLTAVSLPLNRLHEMHEAANSLGFGPNSILFRLFDDVIPCLDRLDALGIRAAVVSNWDYSLHRVLKMFGIYDRFVVVKASLEEGVEKPDPRLFELALGEAGFAAEEAFHVGDDPIDDRQGATNAGIRSVLINRQVATQENESIRSLMDLPEAFGWIA